METTNNFTLSEEDRQILKDAIKILRKGKRNDNALCFPEAIDKINGILTRDTKTKQKKIQQSWALNETLLTVNMAKKCIHEIPKIKDSWWLRDAGLYQGYGVCIDRNGNIFDGSDWDEGSTDINFKKGVRPVLVVENHDFNVGDQFAFGNHKWTIIYIYGTNLDLCLAICNAIIDFHRFDKKSNDYESSEMKAIVDADFRTNENKKLL